jgi:hypothetical protein
MEGAHLRATLSGYGARVSVAFLPFQRSVFHRRSERLGIDVIFKYKRFPETHTAQDINVVHLETFKAAINTIKYVLNYATSSEIHTENGAGAKNLATQGTLFMIARKALA